MSRRQLKGAENLLIFYLCTILATIFVTLSTMMMVLGTGLGSTPDEPVPQAATALLGISGLAFLPCMVLLIILIGTRKRSVAITLALVVALAGIAAAVGWFINSNGEMPGNGVGDSIVIGVVAVPLIAAAIMIWRSSALKR